MNIKVIDWSAYRGPVPGVWDIAVFAVALPSIALGLTVAWLTL